MQTDVTTPSIVVPTMLEVVACVLAVVCKRMQQLPNTFGPAVHRRKDTGLSLRAGGRGFSPATKRVAPGYFYWKIEENRTKRNP